VIPQHLESRQWGLEQFPTSGKKHHFVKRGGPEMEEGEGTIAILKASITTSNSEQKGGG